jgi:hypothetical protein
METNPLEAVRAIMTENLERMGAATQGYLDMLEKTARAFPGANQEQISTFKGYIERQVASNQDFGERLLRAISAPRLHQRSYVSRRRRYRPDAQQR